MYDVYTLLRRSGVWCVHLVETVRCVVCTPYGDGQVCDVYTLWR